MNSRILPAALALGIFLLLSQSAAAAPVSEQRIAQVFSDFTDGIEPGCAAGVVKNGKLLHAAAYGYASVEERRKLTPDSLFNIASMSKEFTAMAPGRQSRSPCSSGWRRGT